MLWFYINLKIQRKLRPMSQPQISQIWAQINQILQLQCGSFKLKQLCSRDWYLQVLQIIFPDLTDKLESIQDIQSEEAAIDRMLLLMAQQEIIEEDFLQIKGANIVSGHKESIFYVIQLFMALVEKALEEAEQEQPQEEEAEQEQQEYDEQFDQQKEKSSQKKQEFRQEIQNYKNLPTNKERQYSEKQNQREYHSVLGIGHEFQPEQQNMDEDEDQVFNYKQNGNEHNEETFKNVFPQNPKNQAKLKETNLYNDNEEEQPQKEYLKHKLQKHKSEEHFKNISKKKSPKESKMHQTQQVRKLVSHPQIPKNYPKANNHQQKKLTKDVKKIIKVSRKRQQNQGSTLQRVTSADQLQKKKRQLHHYVASNTKKPIKNEDKYAKMQTLKQKNEQKLRRLLKWKQANLRRQKQQLEQDMQMKVQLKKQLYLKKINKLILNLQKNRIIEKKRQERERQKRQRETANKRLQAIEHQYKTQMKLLQQKSEDKLGKKTFVNTDHRQIIEALQRQLKKQNEKKIIGLKMKFRREQAQLEDDLQKLQNEIVKTYKRN